MRVAVIADGHIDHGVHGGWNTSPWKRACKDIAQQDFDALIIAGDFFQLGNPKGEALCRAAAGMNHVIKSGTPVIYILGNHEWIGVNTSRGHRPGAYSLKYIPGVTLLDTPTEVMVSEDLAVACMPWPRPAGVETIENHEDDIMDLMDVFAKKTTPRLGIAHAAVTEALGWRGSEIEMAAQTNEWTIDLDQIDDVDVWEHLALGHIHKRQALSDSCGYVGGIDAITFADEGQPKGYSVLEWDDKTCTWNEELQVVGERMFATLTLEGIRSGELQKLSAGTFVRVKLQEGEQSSHINISEIQELGLSYKGFQSVQVEREVTPIGDVDYAIAQAKQLSSPSKLLERWADQEGLSGDQRDNLLDVAAEALDWHSG